MPTTKHESQAKLEFEIEEEKEPERGNWTNHFDFILSCLGYAVGLGNVWRFPYLCYSNGGGAFLIPYTIFLFLAGLPLFYLELALGQYASLGPIAVFQRLAPVLSGLGVAMVVISAIVCVYYNMIIAWTLFYLFASFTSELPWQRCDNDYNTDRCYPFLEATNCAAGNGTFFNHTCYTWQEAVANNIVGDKNVNRSERVAPSQEFFERRMLRKSSGIDEMGEQQWDLVLCLLLAWIIIFLCLIKGIKTSGKVVYFTALFPYVVLVILLIRGATLDGAIDGVTFFITPEWERLKEFKVWSDAASQIFYSLGPAWGGLLTLASYNKFSNNCHRDAWIVAIGNCSTSVFAGFVIFSILGFMAKEAGVKVKDIVAQGSGLAFIAYPEAVTRLPVAPFWAIIFFIMLLTLGLDSQFVMMETIITAVVDTFPKLIPKKPFVVGVLCILWFIMGLSLTCEGGMWMFELINAYAAGWSLMMIGLIEAVTITYLYGFNRFGKNIAEMMGYRPLHYWWIATWGFFTPLVLAVILIWSFLSHKALMIDGYVYPDWSNTLGWLMACSSVICIPLGTIYAMFQNGGMSLALFRPVKEWGPSMGNKLSSHTAGDEDQSTVIANQTIHDNFGYNEKPPPTNVQYVSYM